MEFHKRFDLKKHIFCKHIKVKFECEFCDIQFNLSQHHRSQYNRHVKTHVEYSQKATQQYLDQIYKSKLQEEYPEFPETRSRVCPICNVNFTSISMKRKHMISEHHTKQTD